MAKKKENNVIQQENPAQVVTPKADEPKEIKGKCPYCKSFIQSKEDDIVICPACGATVRSCDIEPYTDPVVDSGDDQGKKKKFNIAKKWWFWVALVLTVVIIIAIIAGTTGNSSEPKSNVYEKNQTITVSQISLSVLDVSTTKSIDGIGTSDFTTVNNYLVVLVKLTNNQSTSYYLSSSDFYINYNGHKYEQLPTESYWYGYHATRDGLSYGKTINSGLSDELYLVFEVPDSIDNANYVLTWEKSYTDSEIKLY